MRDAATSALRSTIPCSASVDSLRLGGQVRQKMTSGRFP
jgi:hypothetical protein